MYTDQPHKSDKHWAKAWGITLVVHIILFVVLAWFLRPDNLVRVVRVTPLPDEVVDLLPTQSLRPLVYFSKSGVRLQSVHLCRVDENGTKISCVKAARHAENDQAVVFDAVHAPGRYELVIEEDAFDEPLSFDGEFLGALPSGDGEPGGEFKVFFEINEKPQELVTASVFDAKKPVMNEASASKAGKTEVTPPQKPVKTHEKPKPKKQKKQQPPAPAEIKAPVASAPEQTPSEISNAPSTIKLNPQILQISPQSMSPTLLMEAAHVAEAVFQARDTNAIVEEAARAKKEINSAYNADGPTVGIGERGNAVSHEKDVAEYLALMHKEIHPRWAEGYLLRLDTVYRGADRRLSNPELEAVMEITLDSLGKVIDVRVVRSSGITDYDAEAIHVAWRCSPGTTPPQKMLSKDGKAYIHWTFWRDTRQCGVFGVKVYRLDRGRREDLEFSLKKVQQMEKKLGLQPSMIQGVSGSNHALSHETEPNPSPQSPDPVKENINPLAD